MKYSQQIKDIASLEELQAIHNERIVKLALSMCFNRKPRPEELSRYIIIFQQNRNVKKLIIMINNKINIKDTFSLRTKDIYFSLKTKFINDNLDII